MAIARNSHPMAFPRCRAATSAPTVPKLIALRDRITYKPSVLESSVERSR